jgi:hypothetical protein
MVSEGAIFAAALASRLGRSGGEGSKTATVNTMSNMRMMLMGLALFLEEQAKA